MGEEFIAGLTIFFMFGTPLLICMLIFIGWWISTSRKHGQTDKSRQSFERLAAEKLEVMKTAIAMGYDDDQLNELDARLEKLVGADRLSEMLDSKTQAKPGLHADLLDADLVKEVDRLKSLRDKQRN